MIFDCYDSESGTACTRLIVMIVKAAPTVLLIVPTFESRDLYSRQKKCFDIAYYCSYIGEIFSGKMEKARRQN